jgi:hypothetical protein
MVIPGTFYFTEGIKPVRGNLKKEHRGAGCITHYTKFALAHGCLLISCQWSRCVDRAFPKNSKQLFMAHQQDFHVRTIKPRELRALH